MTARLPRLRLPHGLAALCVAAALVVAAQGLAQTGSGTGAGTGERAEVAPAEPRATSPSAVRGASDDAAAPPSEASRVLRVATKPFAPFVFMDEGRFRGFSIEIWDLIARELDIEYEWVGTTTVAELLETVRDGRSDVAIAGITITAEREQLMDFTYPFFQSGLQVLVSASGSQGGSGALGVLTSPTFLKTVGLLFLILFAAANVLWVLERRKSPDMFPRHYVKGVWEAFWWSAVTVTTVGYGDKTPKSVAGRLVAILWMFAGLVFIGFFTASITTVLTVQQLEGSIAGPEDLPGRRVATVTGTTAASYLYDEGAVVVEYDNFEECGRALLSGSVEAVVYDSPALRYFAAREAAGRVRVVGPIFMEQSYGIALPTGSRLREPISRALLELRESGAYGELYVNYFGE